MHPSLEPWTVETNLSWQLDWVTHVDVYSKGWFSDKTNWNQALNKPTQMATFTTCLSSYWTWQYIHFCKLGKKDYMFLVQKWPLHARLVTLAKSLLFCLTVGRHIAVAIILVFRQIDY